MSKKVLPLEPGPLGLPRMMERQEHHRLRKKKIEELVQELWPALWEKLPASETDFILEEFDLAIRLIRNRRNNFKRNRPAKARGGQQRWDDAEYRRLLIIHDHLRKEEGLKGGDLHDRLCDLFGINSPTKIKRYLAQARKLDKP